MDQINNQEIVNQEIVNQEIVNQETSKDEIVNQEKNIDEIGYQETSKDEIGYQEINIDETINKENTENISIIQNNLPNFVIENFEKELQNDFSKTEEKKVEEKQIFNTLCFSGGGIKGITFLGALKKLIEEKIINICEIRKFVGTSVGSILAFLLTLGWDLDEIIEFVNNFNFNKLNSEINSLTFLEEYGIQNGERLKLLFIKFLESKFNVKDITFKNLYELTKKKLVIIGTNLSKGIEEAFDYRNTPELSVITALRISVSIPIFFSPIKINNNYYVDGGIKNNFPINYCSKKTTIGLYIKNSFNNEIENFNDLIGSVFAVISDTISEKNIRKNIRNIVQIRNTKYDITNFDLNIELKKKLFLLGSQSAEDFIKNYYQS